MSSSKEMIHKYYKMGRGKYRLIDIWSAQTSQNGRIINKPECCKMVCDHCGTAIIHHFILEDEDKKLFSVGSSCIAKLEQYDLVTAAQTMENERQLKLRQVKAELKREQKQAEYYADIESQRQKNGGLTNQEVLLKTRELREQENEKQYIELSKPIVELLEQVESNFCDDVIYGLSQGKMPTKNAKRIVVEIMTKQGSKSRKNSKAYKELLPKITEQVDQIEQRFAEIRQEHIVFLNKHFGIC